MFGHSIFFVQNDDLRLMYGDFFGIAQTKTPTVDKETLRKLIDARKAGPPKASPPPPSGQQAQQQNPATAQTTALASEQGCAYSSRGSACLLWFEYQQRFAPVCGGFGQIDGLAELFDGDRLPLGHAQRAAVGELKCPVDRCGHPILRGLGEPAEQPEPSNGLGFVDQ